MREIKFRAWNKDDKKMLYFDSDVTPVMTLNGVCVEYRNGIHCNVSVDYALMQSTGLKDKNGKEIYEGDIVKVPYYGNLHSPKIEEVKIEATDGEYLECWPFSSYSLNEDGYAGAEKAEIIGNIYENPELLTFRL